MTAMRGVSTAGERLLSSPTTGKARCCARAVSGHTMADPVITLMKSRRRKAGAESAWAGGQSISESGSGRHCSYVVPQPLGPGLLTDRRGRDLSALTGQTGRKWFSMFRKSLAHLGRGKQPSQLDAQNNAASIRFNDLFFICGYRRSAKCSPRPPADRHRRR